MASLVANDEIIVVTCGNRALALREDETQLHVLSATDIREEEGDGNEETIPAVEKHSSACILGADLSRCNKWLVLCSSHKELSLWDTRNWTLVSTRQLSRSAAKVRFTPTGNDVIVADKTGDAYTFSVQDPNKQGTLLLGHLSMLLDVLVSDDEQYVITCDRDEKIRVSRFPNAYNIQAYCLGHAEFVSCISFLPHNVDILVSGSGDGTIKFWDYVKGRLVYEISCVCHIESKYLSRFICAHTVNACDGKSDSDQPNSTENPCVCGGNVPAVVNMSCCKTNTSSLIGVSIANFKGCLIFRVCGDTKIISCSVTQVLPLLTEPWDMHLSQDGILWYLSDNEEKPFSAECIDDNGNVKSDDENSDKITRTLSLFNSHSAWFRHISVIEQMHVLYKRKFDNVHNYLEKKKARLTPSIS